MAKRNTKKRSSSLLSKKNGLITKSKEIKASPKTLKPLRARQLIRRFHVLIKYKSNILSKLREYFTSNEQKKNNDDDYYKKWINGNVKMKKIYDYEWNKIFNELKINKTPSSVIDPKTNDIIDNSMGVNDLVRILGKIDGEIEKRGGLKTYQIASTLGQDGKRGGDSSKLLVKWMNEIEYKYDNNLKALEIGCLSSKNEISKCKLFKDITRIDLHSQEPGIIEEEDFLERIIPTFESEKFDCISCSLVVNFVPSPELRGDMMCRMCDFLKEPVDNKYSLLFFVIPLPCIENSRYFDNEIMNIIWKKLGFEKLKYHQSTKLAYWLMKWKGSSYVDMNFILKKKEIRKGSDRNNFCIVIRN
ncbi:hypothetical protein C6P42_000923 [Pichia californica]|nr:hypothetical protein C6P42_000923 [[Candida] californica]